MKRVALRTAIAGALLAAVIPACAPMVVGGDGGDTGPQSDVSRDTAVDGGNDAVSTDVPGTDGSDVVGKDAADVPTTDVPTTDVPTSDVPSTDVPTTDAMDVPATDVPGSDVVTTDVPSTDGPSGRCSSTTVLTLGGTVSGTLSGANEFPSTMCQGNAGGPEQVYTLHIDATIGVEFTTGGSLDTILSIRTACGDSSSETECNDDSNDTLQSDIRTVLAPGDYFVVVDEYGSDATGGAFTLTTTTFTVAPNSTCGTAATFTAPGPVSGDSTGGTVPDSTCLTSSDGYAVYYSVTVPAHTRMAVSAIPGGTPAWSPVLRVQADCATPRCLASATAPSDGMTGTVNVDNHGDVDATYILSVGSPSTTTGGPFTLTSTSSSIPTTPNAMCTNATPIMNGTMLTGENTDLGIDTLQASCIDTADGRVLYYRASIPAASVLTVTATPTGTWNPVVRVLDACGATTCLASADIGGDSEAESVRYTNSGTTPVSVLVAVGSGSADTSGLFDLATTIVSLPYSETSVATACDDMTAATTVAGVTTDDSASPIAPLPFTFSFMGTSAAYYSVTSNGFMQLWTDTSGSPSTTFTNDSIPNTSDPNGFVAPLWDDFLPDSTSSVRAQEFTTGERHFTVQWTNLGFYRDSSARVTMQAKLFATSNRIEFHYCTITPGTGAMNSESATVGVENLAGDNGYQHSFDTADRVSTTNAIVLTPVP